MAENKPNTGVAFFNKDKTKETQPDFVGHIDVDGKDYSLAIWFSKSKAKGELYMFAKVEDRITMDPDVQQGRDYTDGPVRPY